MDDFIRPNQFSYRVVTTPWNRNKFNQIRAIISLTTNVRFDKNLEDLISKNRENKQFEIETFTIATKIKSGDIPES